MRNLNFLFSNSVQGESDLTRYCPRDAFETPLTYPRHLFCKMLILSMLLMVIGVGSAWGGTATFTPSSRSAGTLAGAPTGATATYYNSYNNANQITNGNTATLTLSGFDGCTINGVTLRLRKSSGTKTAGITATANDAQFINQTVASNSLTTSYQNFSMTLSTDPIISTGKTIVIVITPSASSIYVESFTIAYTAGTPKTVSFNTGTGNPSVSSRTETSGGAGITLPSTSDLTPTCSGDGWELYGWATSAYGSSSTTTPPSATFVGLAGKTYHPTSNITLYAVYRQNVSTSTSTTTYTINGNWTSGAGNWAKVAGANLDGTLASGKWGLNSGSSTAVSPVSYEGISNIKFTGSKSRSGSGTIEFFYGDGTTWTTLGSKAVANTQTWTISPTKSGQLKIIFSQSAGNVYIASIAVTHQMRVDNYWSNPTCCTQLGSINGSVSLTQGGNSVTISGWSDVSDVGTYTVKMYKKNGGGTWDPVSGTASGGSAGTAGTRTGITSGSKSVTYTGLEVESEYKFTVQAIAGSAAFCDGEETDVTNINTTDVSSTPFKFRYSICIDDGTGNNWTHHYITPTGNTDEGSVTLTSMPAHVDCYQFKIYGGLSGNWGQTGTGKIEGTTATAWTLNGGNQVYLKTGAAGDYVFTVDYSGTTNPKVSVTYPSADQDEGYVIYYDNSVLNWSSLYYRIGNNSNCSKVDAVLVTGTDKFYKITTPDYDNMDAWHIANNYGWTGSNSVYRTKTNSTPAEAAKAITNSISFQQYVVTGDITVIPTTTHSTGEDTGDAGNNNCEFYTINTPTSGMLTHNVSVGTAAHGTLVATYTNTSGATGQTVAEGANADLAHRCIVTITATPDDGYSCTSLTVNGAAFTSGNEHILTADATIAATFTAQTSTVTLDNNDATSGSQQTVSATYDATMPLTTTSSTPVAALSRTGYTFTGWWDATSGGTQYYSYNAGTSTLSSARTWDKTGVQTLKAQWSINSYTLTWAWGGGSTSAASGEDYTAAGSVAYNTALEYPADNTMSRNGYTFTGWSSSATNMPAEALTITAQWEAKQYTVTLDNKSATTSGSTSVTATFDAILPTIIPPTKDGYRFDGYWTEASGGTKYINADGTGATAYKKYSAGEHKLHAHWVAQLTFSVNGVIDDELTRDDNTAMPSTATVPTACGDCWAFMGWSTDAEEDGAPAYAGGDTHEFGSPTTLYAVFGKAEYQWINSTSELVANDYYVLTNIASSKEYAISNTANPSWSTDASSTEVTDKIRENATGYILYNPTVNNIWKFTGTKDAGQLQNVGNTSFYLNLTGSGNILSTTDNLTFTLGDHGQWTINSTKYLRHYTANDWDAAASLTKGDFSCYLYHQTSAEYATVPNCETYTITWMVNGVAYTTGSPTEETNTCTGIETLPTAPSNSTLDCADKFMGWSEYTLIGTGQSAPADLFTDVADAPAINEDKTFYAVFAKGEAGGSGSVVLSYTSLGLTTSYESGSTKTVSGIDFNCNDIMTGASGQDGYQKIQFKKSSTGPGYLYNSEAMPGNITSIVFESTTRNMTVNFGASSNPDGSAETKTCSSGSTTATPTGNYQYFKITNAEDNAAYTGTITINYTDVTYNNYVTSCCDKNITLSDPTITDAAGSGATITFDKSSPVATCGGETTVTATLTLPAGYEATALSFSGGSVSVSPEISLPVTATTVYTLTFDANTNATLTTTATVAAKTATAWTWTYNSGAIPDPLVLYVGINKQLDVTYTPADLLNGQKNYTVTKTDAHVSQGGKAYDYYTMRGAPGVTTETNSTVTFSLNGLSQTVNVTVKPQPKVYFVDIVHNETFDPVMPAVASYVANFVRQTPTHADVAEPGTGNTCEKQHLHLIGWIRSDYSKVEDYLDGTGAKPSITELTDAGTDGEGLSYYFEPNADINVEVYNGLTFYAVWAKIE